MTTKRDWEFSSFKKNGGQSTKENDPIHLENCPRGGNRCIDQRSEINKNIKSSHELFQDRQYNHSIDELKAAFHKTLDLQDSPCNQCASLFRHRILESMEQVNQELRRMTTGLFGSRRYKISYQYAVSVMEELRQLNK
jgi:hypothetical protein